MLIRFYLVIRLARFYCLHMLNLLFSVFLYFFAVLNCAFTAIEIPIDQRQNGDADIALIDVPNVLKGSDNDNEDSCSPPDASFCARNTALSAQCLKCDFPVDCAFGVQIFVNCSPVSSVSTNTNNKCDNDFAGGTIVRLPAKCRFCWQLEPSEIMCDETRNCSTNDLALHLTKCRAKTSVLCAGRRHFFKNVRCHWTSGHSWGKALFLSVTLGGFGVDRFYLGHWKSAIGKLFSFGGLGVWTLLDIVLIAVGYIRPADESLYI